MATRLGLYNAACRLIGDQSLGSLTEDAERRRTLDQVYSDALIYALEQGYWNFAKRTIEASDVPSVVPVFGFQYAFTKPDDWVRTMMVSGDARFGTPLREYEDEHQYWYANVTPLYVGYVSKDPSYGLDLAQWPMTFTRFVEAHLAAEICERTSQNAAKHDLLRKMERARLMDARSKDAMNEPTRFPPSGSWTSSRGGRSNRSGWNGSLI